MANNPPVAELSNESANVYVHNRAGIAPGCTHIIKFAQDEKLDALEVLRTAPPHQLRQLFATVADTQEPSLILFHYGTEDTNSQQPELHIHRVSGELSKEFNHIQAQKTYVPHPNKNLAKDLEKFFISKGRNIHGLVQLDLDKNGIQPEAAFHRVLMDRRTTSLGDFAEKATGQGLEFFRNALADAIELYPVGARVIIDERFNPIPGFFTVHILAGENLGQNGQKHRWFEAPGPVA